MKSKKLMLTTILATFLATSTHANDINSSWDVRTLKGHAYSSIVKTSKQMKFIEPFKNSISLKKNKEKTTIKAKQNEPSSL